MKFELNKNLFYVKNGIVGTVDNEIPEKYYLDGGGEIKEFRNGQSLQFGCNKIVFATENLNLEGVPILELPDEDEILTSLAKDELEFNHPKLKEKHEIGYIIGFVQGYEKAKEVYKWTDEDVQKIIELVENNSYYKSEAGKSIFSNEEEREEILKKVSQPRKVCEIDLQGFKPTSEAAKVIFGNEGLITVKRKVVINYIK